MGEWQAWHPTVSRQSRSTDITDAFGPGTRWSAGPESYIDEVVAASPGLRAPSGFAVPSGPGEPVLVPEGGGPPARSPHASLRLGVVDLEARPGPAAALSHPGMHPGPSAPSTLVARVRRERPGPAVPTAPSTLVARVRRGRPGPAAALRYPGMHLGPPEPSTLVARVRRGRPDPNVADPRPRRRITVHTTACAKNVTD